MGGFIPLGDASRPLRRFAFATVAIIVLNAYVFLKELVYGDRFVWIWSVVPIRIVHGYSWITILTSMFMHASWMTARLQSILWLGRAPGRQSSGRVRSQAGIHQ